MLLLDLVDLPSVHIAETGPFHHGMAFQSTPPSRYTLRDGGPLWVQLMDGEDLPEAVLPETRGRTLGIQPDQTVPLIGDVVDCQWLQQLHTYGLLRDSFRPDSPPVHTHLSTARNCPRRRGRQQHMQRALVPMILQLHRVVSDVVGETGLRIIESILDGEHDPEVLVKLRDQRCKKSTIAEMKAALNGHYTDEGLFVLGQSLRISGGRVLSRRTRKVANRASAILRMAALVIGRTDTWLGRFNRRKKAHLGAPKAITATARKLACVVYHLLKYQENFRKGITERGKYPSWHR